MDGQRRIELALILGLVVVAVVVALVLLGGQVSQAHSVVGESL